jgi:hypothetical protein
LKASKITTPNIKRHLIYSDDYCKYQLELNILSQNGGVYNVFLILIKKELGGIDGGRSIVFDIFYEIGKIATFFFAAEQRQAKDRYNFWADAFD